MSLVDQIAVALNPFAKKLAEDINKSLNDQLSKEHSRVQEASLRAEPLIITGGDLVRLQIVMSGGYWIYLKSGRRIGAKQPPSDAFGKKWQNLHGIDARQVLIDIRRKKGLKVPGKRSLNYDKAVKSLSFIIARSIKKKGIRPKPFIDNVLNDGRLDELRNLLFPIIKKDFELQITIN